MGNHVDADDNGNKAQQARRQREQTTTFVEPKTAGLSDADERIFLKKMERVKGIEPSYSAWKAAALPLSYTRALFCA